MTAGNDGVRRIVESWPELSVEDWREICTADVKYQNMPWQKVVTEGPDGIHAVLKDFAGKFDVTMEVHQLGADGNLAFSERTEHFTPRPGSDGESFDLPVTGVFELRDGKVAAWRDYFDRRAMKA
jgi:limonene-1,2-epoxide hydrolase